MAMRVVAVDPAPTKESTLYCSKQGFKSVPAGEMEGTLDCLEPPVLLCWDAPLTGPKDPSNAGKAKSDFSQRCIESFFSKKGQFKAPKGISVRPYSGCSHWTITRSVLGLPRVGRHDREYCTLPFVLMPDERYGKCGKAVSKLHCKLVVEIHPAVAAWLWCRRKFSLKEDWTYKGNEGNDLRQQMWEHIRKRTDDPLPRPENDDQFDALVGYVLGTKWLDGDSDVVLLGDRETGAMLLPRVKDLEKDLEKEWKCFRRRWDR